MRKGHRDGGQLAGEIGGSMGDRKIEVLKMIADDMKNDAKNFDGRPFNGKTVAEYFGNQGAAIVALADIVRSILGKNEDAP